MLLFIKRLCHVSTFVGFWPSRDRGRGPQLFEWGHFCIETQNCNRGSSHCNPGQWYYPHLMQWYPDWCCFFCTFEDLSPGSILKIMFKVKVYLELYIWWTNLNEVKGRCHCSPISCVLGSYMGFQSLRVKGGSMLNNESRLIGSIK